MKLNSKLTGALAWTGLVVILAVPSAEMLTGKPKASLTSDMDQVRTASIKPFEPQQVKAGTTADPVEEFVKSGKKLPSYISGTPTAAPKKPGTITINPDGTIDKAPTETAVIGPMPKLTAPIPAPASQRPKTPLEAEPQPEAPLIIDETELAQREEVEVFEPDPIIAGEELDEWDSGSLAEYLERRGLLSESERAAEDLETQFDEDGFFLSDGPNANKRSRVRRFEDDELLF